MTTRETVSWTGDYCKNGARINIRRSEFYILQQDGPYDTETTRECCSACEAEDSP